MGTRPASCWKSSRRPTAATTPGKPSTSGRTCRSGPHARIPAVVDHDRGGLAVFESSAILSYLTRRYDPEHRFSFPPDSDDYTVAEEWIAWHNGGIGPTQGQALRFTEEKIPFGIYRFVGEQERLYGVLDARLRGRDYVAGPGRGTYSIADMTMLGWAQMARICGLFDIEAMFPSVLAWVSRCTARPATRRGLSVPSAASRTNEAVAAQLAGGDDELVRYIEETKKLVNDVKAQYGYKYASP